MTRYVLTIAAVVLLALAAVVWFAHREAVALDQRAAAELEAIRARAQGEPVVIVREGPVRVVERERVVVQRVAPGARPVGSATVETTATATGAPVIDCPQRSGALSPAEQVRCPDPLLGCRTTITGWRHATSGAVLATGTQTLSWRWPGQDWQHSAADLTPENTSIQALPMVLQPDAPPRWLAGGLVGLDSHGSLRYGAVAARRLGGYRGVDLHAVAVGMVGGGDVVVTAGLAAGW